MWLPMPQNQCDSQKRRDVGFYLLRNMGHNALQAGHCSLLIFILMFLMMTTDRDEIIYQVGTFYGTPLPPMGTVFPRIEIRPYGLTLIFGRNKKFFPKIMQDYDWKAITKALSDMQKEVPCLTTVVIVCDDSVMLETIIHSVDLCRGFGISEVWIDEASNDPLSQSNNQ